MSEKSKPNNKLNIIPGIMTPAEIRELKAIFRELDIETIILPDYSETLDAPMYKKGYKKLPNGGTSVEDIVDTANSIATIEFGYLVPNNISPGKFLKDKYGVPFYSLPFPIGLTNTDEFYSTLENIFDLQKPEYIEKARGRLLDAMVDSHKYNGEGKVTIFGEPEIVYGVSSLCLENGIIPTIISTGSDISIKSFEELQFYEKFKDEITFLADTDFETIQSFLSERDVNLLIGHSDGKFLSEKENIPLLRIGFPIHDRIGSQRQMHIGYEGTMNLLDKITNYLIEIKLLNYRNKTYDKYYKKQVF